MYLAETARRAEVATVPQVVTCDLQDQMEFTRSVILLLALVFTMYGTEPAVVVAAEPITMVSQTGLADSKAA